MKEGPKINIRLLTQEQMGDFFESHSEKKFRGKQVFEWIWAKSATTFGEMTNLSFENRELLEKHFEIKAIQTKMEQKSSDGTIKSAFQLHDGHIVEGVLIPADDRMTACVSSQVGCSLTCKFCATGKLKRIRNLDGGEIYDQVVKIRAQALHHFKTPLTNIVYMGMGEPLLNYANVLDSVHHITDPGGLNMSPTRITVSTAGISKMIKKLGEDKVKFNLALSLHAANDKKRSEIMPINEENTLESLKEALKFFYNQTGTRVTYEYIVFKDFNDTLTDAAELSNFSKFIPVKVNLIEYNSIGDGLYKNTSPERILRFKSYLEDQGIIVNVRRSRGKDIDAACGQLANKGQDSEPEKKKTGGF